MTRCILLSIGVVALALGSCQTVKVGQPASESSQVVSTSASSQIYISSKNTITEIDLLNDKGKSITIKVELDDVDKIKTTGLVIIATSSTPNMDDEEWYASKFKGFGLATAIVHSAAPRFKSKFSAAYTSNTIARDIAETVSAVSNKFGPPKSIFVLGGSLGSHAVFKTAWSDIRERYPQLKMLTAGFMMNAACPDSFLGRWDSSLPIYALNGIDDTSTPPSACKTLAASGKVPSFKSLTYPGDHHFESIIDSPVRWMAHSKHVIPTCSIDYQADLYPILKRRDGSGLWDSKESGFGKPMYKWLGKNCVKKGNRHGYNKKGSAMVWDDIKTIISSGKL